MLLGTGASSRLMRDFPGMTVHRRTVQLKEFFVDLHMRVREALVATSTFGGEGYLSMLGQELGNMQSGAYNMGIEPSLISSHDSRFYKRMMFLKECLGL